MTPEHVLIELLEDRTARSLIASEKVDVEDLRARLIGHPSPLPTAGDEALRPRADEALQNAMRRAITRTLISVAAGSRIKVELIGTADDQPQVVSGFSGSAGAVFRDAREHSDQRSGNLGGGG